MVLVASPAHVRQFVGQALHPVALFCNNPNPVEHVAHHKSGLVHVLQLSTPLHAETGVNCPYVIGKTTARDTSNINALGSPISS